MNKVNIGIDIGGSHIGLALVNQDGRIIYSSKIDNGDNIKKNQIIDSLVKHIKIIIDKSNSYNQQKINSIGIGIPGILNLKKGIIIASPNLKQFNNFKIRDNIKNQLKKMNINIPVFINNDANCAVIGEFFFGQGKKNKVNNMINITLGTGIGGGIIIKNKLYSGISNNAAELGHMSIKFDGKKCNCGSFGCWEAYAGTNGFIEISKKIIMSNKNNMIVKMCRHNLNKITPEIVGRAAQKKDKIALKIFESYGFFLGIGLSNLINIFNIELITLTGGIAKSINYFIEPAMKVIKERSFENSNNNVKILKSSLSNNAGIIGASAIYKIINN